MGKGFGYKTLLSSPEFLKVRARARQLMGRGSDLIAIYYKERQLIFKTTSATTPGVVWTQIIEVTDAAIEQLAKTKTFSDVERLMKDSALKVYCDCPAFLYWGFKYLAWKKGYGLKKEIRRPIVRNPYEQGYVCKHLYFVLQLYPFLCKSLASKFKKYVDQKIESEGMSGIQRMRMNKNEQQFVESNKPKPNDQQIEQMISEELNQNQ